jgi:7-cyano-7-deazaguanine synthase in queuosine biosynthesis
LSGGIDSALVCWAMRELNANINGVHRPGSRRPFRRKRRCRGHGRALGIPHEIVDMPAMLDFSLDELVDAYSEPFVVSPRRRCCGCRGR